MTNAMRATAMQLTVSAIILLISGTAAKAQDPGSQRNTDQEPAFAIFSMDLLPNAHNEVSPEEFGIKVMFMSDGSNIIRGRYQPGRLSFDENITYYVDVALGDYAAFRNHHPEDQWPGETPAETYSVSSEDTTQAIDDTLPGQQPKNEPQDAIGLLCYEATATVKSVSWPGGGTLLGTTSARVKWSYDTISSCAHLNDSFGWCTSPSTWQVQECSGTIAHNSQEIQRSSKGVFSQVQNGDLTIEGVLIRIFRSAYDFEWDYVDENFFTVGQISAQGLPIACPLSA